MADYSPITIARFWSKVGASADRRSCWPWRAHVAKDGYGKFRSSGATSMAHRVAWRIVHGDIPPGMMVRHKCDNRRCCNPHHLELGTNRDNMADMVARGRSTKGEKTRARFLAPPMWRGFGSASLAANATRLLRRITP